MKNFVGVHRQQAFQFLAQFLFRFHHSGHLVMQPQRLHSHTPWSIIWRLDGLGCACWHHHCRIRWIMSLPPFVPPHITRFLVPVFEAVDSRGEIFIGYKRHESKGALFRVPL